MRFKHTWTKCSDSISEWNIQFYLPLSEFCLSLDLFSFNRSKHFALPVPTYMLVSRDVDLIFVLGWLWGGVGVVFGWRWGGVGVALGWHWGDVGVPLEWRWSGVGVAIGVGLELHWGGVGVTLGWHWGDVRVALGRR